MTQLHRTLGNAYLDRYLLIAEPTGASFRSPRHLVPVSMMFMLAVIRPSGCWFMAPTTMSRIVPLPRSTRWHPDIEGIGWDDIWEAVRRQNPSSSPVPRATDAEYQAIKNSIATFGLVQPVIVDETGNIIAGRLRKRACIELGVNCPTEVIAGLTRDEKDQLSFELDFLQEASVDQRQTPYCQVSLEVRPPKQ